MAVDELLAAAITCYRSTLRAVGKACAHAIPGIGEELQQALLSIESSGITDVPSIELASGEAAVELINWSDHAADYYRRQTEEVKEIMIAVGRVAGCIGERDQQHAKQIEDLSKRLLEAAHLEDLGEIRRCLAKNADALSEAAESMARSGQESVAELRAEVVRYETLLRESERRAFVDPLTGLQNRRGIEDELKRRMQGMESFCVLILDLDGFKRVNDTYGHVAGDDLLKQFAGELTTHCERGDVAGRLGGDEFIIISNRRLGDTDAYVKRVRNWIFGNYKINDGQYRQTVGVSGSAGVAEWNGMETISALLSRADHAMYREKADARGGKSKISALSLR